MSSFTSRRTIENCLMSARSIRATAHAPRSQLTLNMFTTQILNSKATGFTLFTDRWPVASSQWMKGRSLNMTSHVFVPLTDLRGFALEVYCSTRAWICMNEWYRIPIAWHSDAPPKARGQELLASRWTGRVCQPTRVRLNEMPRKLSSMFA